MKKKTLLVIVTLFVAGCLPLSQPSNRIVELELKIKKLEDYLGGMAQAQAAAKVDSEIQRARLDAITRLVYESDSDKHRKAGEMFAKQIRDVIGDEPAEQLFQKLIRAQKP